MKCTYGIVRSRKLRVCGIITRNEWTDRLPKLDNISKNNGGLFQKKNCNTEKERSPCKKKTKQNRVYERKDGMV